MVERSYPNRLPTVGCRQIGLFQRSARQVGTGRDTPSEQGTDSFACGCRCALVALRLLPRYARFLGGPCDR
jgi:hypothetical protein